MKPDQEMRELFARWRDSDLSLMAFSREEGVAYSKLLYWRRKLEGGHARRKISTGASKAAVTNLVPVRVVTDAKPSACPSEPFEVWLANGVALNVAAGFDEAELRRLVDVLSAC